MTSTSAFRDSIALIAVPVPPTTPAPGLPVTGSRTGQIALLGALAGAVLVLLG